jgi:predicted AAA+ superfamily ATPase
MYKRDLYSNIEVWLERKEIIIIYGARQVGKTTLLNELLHHRDNAIIFNCERPDIMDILESQRLVEIKYLFQDKTIVAFDEAQKVAEIGTVLKLIYDDQSFSQKIIATGSSSFELANKISEPLTGRNVKFKLFPLSLNEIKQEKEWLWIRENLEQLLVFGTYPEIIDLDTSIKNKKLLDLSSDYLFRDVLKYENLKNPSLLRKLLKALALQLGSQVSYHELSNMLGVSSSTVEKYIDLLEKCFVIFSIPSYSRNLRNEITKSKKFYFYDNGIRNALITSFGSIKNRTDVGALWENFCMSERLKFNETNRSGASMYFWRTYDGAEIDLVEDYNGELTVFEFKWQPKRLFRFPKSFVNTYKPIRASLITRDNWVELLG